MPRMLMSASGFREKDGVTASDDWFMGWFGLEG
jgi:hypothetical protein